MGRYSVLGPAAAVLMLFTLLWKDSVHAALRGRQHSDIEENPWRVSQNNSA